jgi:tetratricopeptide (TPR) repeat protein
MASSPSHAGTHLMLGNMHQQMGQMDKALESWQAGLSVFPNNTNLAAQIALAYSSGGGNQRARSRQQGAARPGLMSPVARRASCVRARGAGWRRDFRRDSWEVVR